MAHNHFSDGYSAKETFNNQIQPPASGGTIDLAHTDGGLVVGNTNSAETWYLPPEEFVPVGVLVSIVNQGSGTITVKDDALNTIATVAGSSAETKQFTLSAALAWEVIGGSAAADLASTASGKGANLVGFEDGGSKTTAATVDAALDEIYVSLKGTGLVSVPLTSIVKEDGTVMIKQATTVTGFSQLSNKNIVIHIPANSTAEAFAATSVMPLDLDGTNNGNLTLNVIVSKNADADALTLDAELYGRVGDAGSWSPDVYAGSAQTIVAVGSKLQFAALTSPPSGVLSAAFVLTLGGINDSDVVYIHDVFWTYQKKLVTS